MVTLDLDYNFFYRLPLNCQHRYICVCTCNDYEDKLKDTGPKQPNGEELIKLKYENENHQEISDSMSPFSKRWKDRVSVQLYTPFKMQKSFTHKVGFRECTFSSNFP